VAPVAVKADIDSKYASVNESPMPNSSGTEANSAPPSHTSTMKRMPSRSCSSFSRLRRLENHTMKPSRRFTVIEAANSPAMPSFTASEIAIGSR
jgi:hypothetical protein